MLSKQRYLIINADDYGIGPATSQGILELGRQGKLSSSVLLANSPHAKEAVNQWHRAGRPMELGWHPVLTLDRPVLPTELVPSLVDGEGRFLPLGKFLRRLLLRQIDPAQIHAELSAQYRACCEMLCRLPQIINTHHHVQIFPPVGAILRDILRGQPAPYLRIVREPWPKLATQRGARLKRLVLNHFGRRESRRQRRIGFVGNDWLVGVIENGQAADQNLFVNLIRAASGNVVELTCHPGKRDETLVGRDCSLNDGMLERRPRELAMLSDPAFAEACRLAGFRVITPGELCRMYQGNRPARIGAPSACSLDS